MKISIEAYNPDWSKSYERVAIRLHGFLKQLNPKIEHIGSTSVPNLAAKPIIDIMVGVNSSIDLDKTINPMLEHHFIYYESFNAMMPFRRLFIGLNDSNTTKSFQPIYTKDDAIPFNDIHKHKLAHIHIWEYESPVWKRHIAFREYLRKHPMVAAQYEQLKKS